MRSVGAGKRRGSSGSPGNQEILPAAVPVVGHQRAGAGPTARRHVFSRGAACQLPSLCFQLLAVGISLDYFSYSIPNCSRGIASEL